MRNISTSQTEIKNNIGGSHDRISKETSTIQERVSSGQAAFIERMMDKPDKHGKNASTME
jgi:hypothetical protein